MISFILSGVGCLISYILLVSQFISGVLSDVGIIEPDSMIWRVIIVVVFLVFIWIPMSVPKQLTSLRFFSMFSTIGIAYITFVVMYDAPTYISQQDITVETFTDFTISRKAFDVLGVFYFAFNAAPV